MKYLLDLHTHTISSGHAYSSLQELVMAAREKGLEMIGVSDHAPSMPGGAHMFHFHNLRVVPREMYSVKVKRGVEANIVDFNGALDMGYGDMEGLDYVIASLHPPCIKPGTLEENTKAVIGAIRNPYVKIIGHPDDKRYPMDYEKVVLAAKENGVLLEVNNASLNPDGFRKDAAKVTTEILNLCVQYQQPIILGSDAHISFDVGRFDFALTLLDALNFPEELIVNTSVSKLEAAFANKIM